jgi:ABC-type transport system involved in multi-copper enzyme maturation permease subunit
MTTLVLADLRARWRSLVGFGAGCFVLLMVLAGTYSAYGGADGFGKTFGAGRSPKLLTAFSGSSSGDIFSPANFLAFGFAHPLFLVLTISVAVSSGVAAIATDVETGRAEMLFTAPVSRSAILRARLAGWLLAQFAVVGCAVLAALVGSRLSGDLSAVSPLVPIRVGVQFLALVFFLGAVAFAVSARARTRGTALGLAAGIAAGSYVANLVALLWSPLGFVRHVDPFGYYDATAAAARVNWGDVSLLVSAGVLLLLLAARGLERRDLV